MAEIKNINAIIQYLHNVQETDWSDPSIPIPEGLWVFDTETRIVYKGDGINLIGDLPPFWNIKNMESISDSFNNQFPDLTGMDNQIVVVNNTGDGYVVGVLDITKLVNIDEVMEALENIADATHTHNDLFYTKSEIDDILEHSSKSITEEERDILSMLVLKELDDDVATYAHMPNGIVDNTLINVNTEHSYEKNSHISNINEARITLQLNDITASEMIKMINNFYIEVSRDNGNTFASSNIQINPMVCENCRFISSNITFDKSLDRSVLNINEIILDDRKDKISNITVTESNRLAQFDSDNTNISIGNVIVLTNDNTIVITKILSNTKIEFLGELSKGTYDVSYIHPLKYDGENKIVNYTQDIKENWQHDNTPINIIGSKYFGMTVTSDKIYIAGGKINNNVVSDSFFEYDINTKSWEELQSFTSPIFGLNLATTDAIYAIGGYEDNTLVTDIKKYDGMNWNIVQDITVQPKVGHNTEAVDDKIISVFGENKNSGIMADISDIEIYNTKLNILHSTILPANLPKRSYAASTVNNKTIYISGGYSKETEETLDDLWECDVKSWENIEVGPTKRCNHCSVNLNNKLLIYGGKSKDKYLNDCWEYDPDVNTWTRLSDGPSSRQNHSSEVHGENLYIHGGYGENGILNDFWKYTRSTDTWTRLSDGPKLKEHSSAFFQNQIILFGGFDGNATNELHIFDIETEIWLESKTITDITPRYGHKLSISNDAIFIFGGIDTNGNYLSDMFKLDPVSFTVFQMTEYTTPRANYAVSSINNDTLLYSGGENSTGICGDIFQYNILNDTWEHLKYNQLLSCTDLIEISGQIYSFGGTDGTLNSSIRKLISHTFEKINYKPEDRCYSTFAQNNNEIHISHGQYNQSYKTHWSYDPIESKWYKHPDNTKMYYNTLVIDDFCYAIDAGYNFFKINLTDNSEHYLFSLSDHTIGGYCKIDEDHIFFVGGYRLGTGTDKTYIYEISTNTLEPTTDYPCVIGFVSSVIKYSNYIYVLGGIYKTDNSVYRYNLTSKEWEYVTEGYSFRYNGTAVIGDAVYLIGSEYTDQMRIFHLDSHTWENLTNLPDKYFYYNCTVYGTDIYAVFGFNKTTTETILRKFDTITRTWSIVDNNTPFYTLYTNIIVYNNKLHFLGSHRLEILKDHWKLNLTDNTWLQLKEAEYTTDRAKGIFVNNKYYVIGGQDAPNIIQIYDTIEKTWTTEYMPISCTYNFAVTKMNDCIYIYASHTLEFCQLHEYNLVTKEWTELQSSPTTRWKHWMVSDDIDNIYCGGGEIAYLQPASMEVWKYTRSTDTWTRLSDQPGPTISEMAIMYKNNIYLASNHGFWKYLTSDEYWIEIDTSIEVTLNPSLLMYEHSLFCVFGKYHNNIDYNGIIKYDLDTATDSMPRLNWKKISTIPNRLTNHTMFNIADTLYLFGGITEEGGANNTMYKYDIVNKSWSTKINDPLLGAFPYITGNKAVSYGNLAYSFGGDIGESHLNDKLSRFTPEFDFSPEIAIVSLSLIGLGNYLKETSGNALDSMPFFIEEVSEQNNKIISYIDKSNTPINVIKTISNITSYYNFTNNDWMISENNNLIHCINKILLQIDISDMLTVDNLHTVDFVGNVLMKKVHIIFTGNDQQEIDLPNNTPYLVPQNVPNGNELILKLTNNNTTEITIGGTSIKWS